MERISSFLAGNPPLLCPPSLLQELLRSLSPKHGLQHLKGHCGHIHSLQELFPLHCKQVLWQANDESNVLPSSLQSIFSSCQAAPWFRFHMLAPTRDYPTRWAARGFFQLFHALCLITALLTWQVQGLWDSHSRRTARKKPRQTQVHRHVYTLLCRQYCGHYVSISASLPIVSVGNSVT